MIKPKNYVNNNVIIYKMFIIYKIIGKITKILKTMPARGIISARGRITVLIFIGCSSNFNSDNYLIDALR